MTTGVTNARILFSVVIAAPRLVGGAMTEAGQQRVIGEILAGILLGPSLLSLVGPGGGLELGVITPTLYTIMVIMALATTLMAASLLGVIRMRNARQPVDRAW